VPGLAAVTPVGGMVGALATAWAGSAGLQMAEGGEAVDMGAPTAAVAFEQPKEHRATLGRSPRQVFDAVLDVAPPTRPADDADRAGTAERTDDAAVRPRPGGDARTGEEVSRQAGSRPAVSAQPESVTGLSASMIAEAVGADERDVSERWPLLEKALRDGGMTDRRSQIAAVATIVTEVGSDMEPINEYGGRGYFRRMYEGRGDLGNVRPGDGARYHGRGFIQLTGRANYRTYGRTLGLPLEDRPHLALRPEVGARVLAEYFEERGVDDAARRGDWRTVRVKVNGGYNGWSHFRTVVGKLERASRDGGSGDRGDD
jgi:hypothetical protein